MTRTLGSLRGSHLASLGLALLVFAAVFAVLTIVNRPPSIGGGEANGAAGLERASGAAGTEELIASLQSAVREDPGDAQTYALLGDAYYQRSRETGDPAYYSRAERAYDSALATDADDVTATIGKGTLALARHDFQAALELGRRAHELAPDLARPYTVLADAQLELGRYGDAARTLDRLVRLKPSLPTYARISYFRELHGDLAGAVAAMRLAVSAGGGSPEASAYVRTLLGDLELSRGRYGAAALSYREALAADPGHTRALAGLARVDAAQGAYGSAIRRYRTVVERLPLPEYAIALAETEEAAGRIGAARRDYALVEAEARLLAQGGVDADLELALFEADHGQPARAVTLARGVWERAPGVRSADAYSWALHKAGRTDDAVRMSERAMRLGSRDPSFLFHAGMIARAAGDTGRAEALLGRLVSQSPRFSPLFGPRARAALEGLR
jgi:tetratricopeptide (TPR) repeat protein